METYLHKDNTRGFFVDIGDKSSIEAALNRNGIVIVSVEEAFRVNEILVFEFRVKAEESEIAFALDSMVKLIRPYPRGK